MLLEESPFHLLFLLKYNKVVEPGVGLGTDTSERKQQGGDILVWGPRRFPIAAWPEGSMAS